jgi:tryptophan synthase alpha chain
VSDKALKEVFSRAEAQGRAALIPYVTAGVPSLAALPGLIAAAFSGGADVLEVGVPFSDPLADGPILQRAAEMALAGDYTLAGLFQTLAATPKAGPVVLLTYINPVLAWGPEHFVDAARDAGVSGLIVPDLPWEESHDLDRMCRRGGLALIPLAAPTSTDAHLRRIGRARGFVYAVSLTGVTGVRQQLDPDLPAFAARVRRLARLPVAIGFGISTPDHARAVARLADGVIVGSALVRAVMEAADDPAATVRAFVAQFREAVAGRHLEEVGAD